MSDLFLLRNTEIIDLFEIKINDYEGYLRFHGSKNFNKDIVFKGQAYLFIPSEISNLEYNSEGKQNRPTLLISNINNFITNFIKDRNDLLGCRFFRKKILAKDLDDINFGGSNKNTLGQNTFTSFISNDTFIIQKKNYEQKEKVEFVLANILDIDGLTVPTRKVYNDSCQWQYRGYGCNYGKINGYNGPSVAVGSYTYTDLAVVNSDYSLGANLVGWFKPNDSANPSVQTFSGTVTVQEYPNNKPNLVFDKLTAWATAAGSATITIANSPKKYVNVNRLGNQTGILFTQNWPSNTWDTMQINLDFQTTPQNCTIFYVSEMVNKVFKTKRNNDGLCSNGGVPRRGLTTNAGSGNNFLLGYHNYYEDVLYINKWVTPQNSIAACPYINTPRVYGAVLPTSTSEKTIFYRDGNKITEQTGFAGKPKNFGINLLNGEQSEIVVYEVIVYNTLLTNDQVKAVSSYLASKYKTPISYNIIKTINKQSSEYFIGYDDGNLGVPMADENNKIFLKNQASTFVGYESYELTNIVYKGDYDNTVAYTKGDFVKIDPSLDYDFNEKAIFNNLEMPSKFFVCIGPEASGQHPFSYTNIWKEDKCSKNLNGCSLRFKDPNINVPFGGFPGTIGYDYRLPG